MIGLVLAGRHPLTLCGLSQVFAQEADCAVLAVCSDPEAVVEAVRRHQPDVAILDLDRAGAFRLLRRLQRARLATRIVVLAAASEEHDMGEAVRLGAHAVVPKELTAENFVACIRKVYAGERFGDGHAVEAIPNIFRRSRSTRHGGRQLTPRETEIARLAVLGISTRDIADRLDVKQGTVKIHLHSIYDKLNVGGRLGLILFARRQGLV